MDDKLLEVKEVSSSSIFSFSRKDVLLHGLRRALDPSVEALSQNIAEGFTDLVNDNLIDEDNRYQFTLTVKIYEGVDELEATGSETETETDAEVEQEQEPVIE